MTLKLSRWPDLKSKFDYSTHTPAFISYTSEVGKLNKEGEMHAMHEWYTSAIADPSKLKVFCKNAKQQPFKILVKGLFGSKTQMFQAPCVCVHFQLTYMSHAWNTVKTVISAIEANRNRMPKPLVLSHRDKLNYAMHNIQRATKIGCTNYIDTLPEFANATTLLTQIIQCTKCYLWYNSELMLGDNIVDLKKPIVPFSPHGIKMPQFRMCLLAMMANACIACTHLQFPEAAYNTWIEEMKIAALARLHIIHTVERCVYEISTLKPGTSSPSAAVLFNMRIILSQVDITQKPTPDTEAHHALASVYIEQLYTMTDKFENSYTLGGLIKGHVDEYQNNVSTMPYSFVEQTTPQVEGYHVATDESMSTLKIFMMNCIKFPSKYLLP